VTVVEGVTVVEEAKMMEEMTVVHAAVAAFTPAPVTVHSAAKKNRKSIIKTTNYYAATYMRMAKSVPAARLAIAPNTNAKWPLQSSGHVTWLCFHSQAKYYARLSI